MSAICMMRYVNSMKKAGIHALSEVGLAAFIMLRLQLQHMRCLSQTFSFIIICISSKCCFLKLSYLSLLVIFLNTAMYYINSTVFGKSQL